ncbi:MAG: ornithine carbamoyltransferase [bacterium]
MRHLLSISDLEPASIWRIFNLTDKIIELPDYKPFSDKTAILFFKKPSLRTRLSFEIAIKSLGGESVFITDNEVGLGTREEIKDIARVLSGYGDCIIPRVFSHSELLALSKYANVPVINALSDDEHPCQVLSDLWTIWKHKEKIVGLNLSFIGDCGNNVASSWLLLASMMGINITLCFPKGYGPKKDILKRAKKYSALSGAIIKTITDPKKAVLDAEVIYTDTWTSMGQEKEKEKRIKDFSGFTINKSLLSYAKENCSIMHCMPIHRGEEIEDEIAEGKNSIIFHQARNKLVVTKGILVFLLV